MTGRDWTLECLPIASPLVGLSWRRGGPMLGRRRFLRGSPALVAPGLLAGCGVLPPRAPPPARVARLGFLGPAVPQLSYEALRRGLSDLGYAEGRNLTIEYRCAEGRQTRLPELAAELVRQPADLGHDSRVPRCCTETSARVQGREGIGRMVAPGW